ncbi:MAG TPA: nicotinate (nicotinamide) nucleotide adenylyltransferase [Bacteroidia bacterium]|nr:nicotinate (nicotinamide) nucleotide adenylyltransferase [Bacteroidia bacterium]
MKIGLFFGSFNPIHNGLLVIVGYMADFSDLSQVLLIVSPHNPLKPAGSLLQDHHRFEMVRIAVGDYRKMKASKVEFGLPKPSYTINTLAHLHEQFPDHEFVLIMGSDNLSTFKKWKNWEQIIEHHEIYIYPRPNDDGGELKNHPKVKLVDAPLMQLSSTFIRKAIHDKKDVRYMLPESVYNYIEEMNFYKK